MNTDWLGAEVGVLKAVYYKLMSERQLGPAQAIAQTLFEITEERETEWRLFCLAPGGAEYASAAASK